MKDELISFETAKLAKEVGFDKYCNYSADPEGIYETLKPLKNSDKDITSIKDMCVVPTQSLLQKWLREKHKILVWIKPNPLLGMWSAYVDNGIGDFLVKDTIFENTYEAALEVGLLQTLKLIKT